VGKRSAEVASDSKTYSRALQAYTTHYYRVTCGSSVSAGSFSTTNIPLGNTYMDLPPDKSPTLTPGSAVIDQQTGALLQVAAPSTNHFNGAKAYLGSGGFVRMCSPNVVGPDNGYLCAFFTEGGNPGAAYYYIPATGELRYLGSYQTNGTSGPDGWDVNIIAFPKPGLTTYFSVLTRSGRQVTLKGTYTGNYQAAAPATWLPMSWTPVNIDGGDLASALKRFDSSIQAQTCNPLLTEGDWLFADCRSGIQDTYPISVGIINLITGQAVAARNMMTASPTRFCGEHNFHFMASGSGIPVIEFGFHGLNGGGQYTGGGPYTVTLTQASDGVTTTLQVSGEPTALPTDMLMQAQVGDVFRFTDNLETVRILQKISSTQWIVQRSSDGYYPAISHPQGSTLFAECGDPGIGGGWPYVYWKFLDDPWGRNLIVNRLWPVDGHDDSGLDVHLTEGYGFTKGTVDSWLSKGAEQSITPAPTFAGMGPRTYGSTTAMHPSYHQVNDPNWFVDSKPLNGGNLLSDTHINVSGQLYKYTFPSWFTDSGVHTKILPTLSFTQGKLLTDISGPGSVISTGPDMPNTTCTAFLAGECRPGSQAGDVFANIPDLQTLRCAGSDGPNPGFHDWCALDSPPSGQAVVQLGMVANTVGEAHDASTVTGAGWSRVLSRGLGPVRNMGTLAKTTPDGNWMFFNQVVGTALGPLVMLKMPPFAKQDTLDRSTFIPVTVNVAANPQAASAVVQFGYSEQGAPGQYYCSSRRESCVAISNSVNPANPFKYKDSEQYSGVPCQSGCQITIPLAPQHVAYYQVLYLDATNHVLSLGSQGVVTESAASSTPAPLPGVSVALNPPSANLSASQTSQFTATVTGNTNTAVTWSMNPAVGTLVSGLYTAPASISSSQTVTITATSVADPTKSATATVQLTPTASVSVVVNPLTAILSLSQTLQFTATVTGSTNTAVTWSMNPAVGSLLNGLYTAPSVSSGQTVTITATSVADPTKSASAAVQISPSIGIIVSPLSVTLGASQTYQFGTTVTGTTNTGVAWSMVPSVGSLSNGFYTAPSAVSTATTVAITATSLADPTKSSTAAVQLVADSVSISMSPPNATLTPTQSTQITATVSGSTNTSVNWSTPPLGNLSNGLYTAPATINTAQNVTVTATSQADPTKTGNAVIQLMPAVSMSLSPANAILTPSQGTQFTATVTGTTNTGVTWSMNPSVGNLSNGLYTAPSVITASQVVTIIATSVVDTSKSATATVQLVTSDLNVSLNPLNATLTPSQSKQFTATVTGGSNTAVVWSMTPLVGSLSNGLYTAPAVISTPQTVTITASSVADSSRFGSAIIQLVPVNISISPTSATLLASQSTQFAANVTGSSNTAVAWSMNPSVGSLSANGLYTAPSSIKSAQNVTITATSLANPAGTATAVIHLKPKNNNIRLSPQNAMVSASKSVKFTAILDDDSVGTVVWSNGDGLGAMSNNGVYTAPSMVPAPQDVTITGTLVPADGVPVATSAIVTVMPSSFADNPPTVSWAINAASLEGGPIAAGEILAILGSNLGPDNGVTLALDGSGMVTTTLAFTRVFFDGVPAPLLYVQGTQINVVVPYSVTPGSNVKVEVEYQGKRSAPVTLPVEAYNPGLFTLNGRQGAIVNQDGTVNSADNPAARGSWVSVYGTGSGQTDPPGVDGQVVGLPPPVTLLPTTVRIGGMDAPVLYSGSAAGMVSGTLLVNVRIPMDAPTGSNVPIIVAIGYGITQPGVTIALK